MRFAAFFRRAHVTCVQIGLASASVLALSAAPAQNASLHPQDAPTAEPTIAGVAYVDAPARFAAIGYESDYDPKTLTLTVRAKEQTQTGQELVFTAEKREARLDGMRVFLGEPAILHRGRLYLATVDLERFIQPILHPARLPARALRTIVIDAGHGGIDTGAQNTTHLFDEKVFALDVSLRLQALLGDERWRVLQTRTDDRFVPLGARAEFANKEKADLFISVHFNAVANNSTVRGTETYVLTPRFQRSTSSLKTTDDDKVKQVGNRHDVWNAVLGYHMHRELLTRLKTSDRGLKRARFAVLRLVDCPAVLVEAGYLSNDEEALRIADEEYREEIAKSLYAAILAFDQARAAAEVEAIMVPNRWR